MVTLTAEQQKIVDIACPPSALPRTRIIRVTAGAGAGKTTTLEHLARALYSAGHKCVYVTYNKAAAKDASGRLGLTAQCSTIHSLAYRSCYGAGAEDRAKVVDDVAIEDMVLAHCPVNSMVDRGRLGRGKQPSKSLRRTIAFWVRKTMETFCRSKHDRQMGFNPSTFGSTYYPAKLAHEKGEMPLVRSYDDFYVRSAELIYDKIQSEGLITYDIMMKEAQLRNKRVDCTALLVDESQDCNECQVHTRIMRSYTS